MRFLVAEDWKRGLSLELYDRLGEIQIGPDFKTPKSLVEWGKKAKLGTVFAFSTGIVIVVKNSVALKDLFR